MFRIETGSARSYCDGLNRRSFLQVGVAGMATVGLADILRAKTASAALGQPAKDTSVLLIWLDGGPSHMDMYDMKPNAPAEYRGYWRPTRTKAAGIEISELLPLQAKWTDKFSIIRSLSNNCAGDHFGAAHRMLTGRPGVTVVEQTPKFPSIGAIAAKMCGSRQPGMPPFAAVPRAVSQGIRPGYFGANYLGREYNPFETDGDPAAPDFHVQNFQLPGQMTIDRLEDRRSLRQQLDRMQRKVDQSGAMDAMDRFERQAYEFIAGPAARKAFDLNQEPAAIRDRYGRNRWGQSCLLARRLVEAGSTFVTTCISGWDFHWDLRARTEEYLPKYDQMVAALFQDLTERGLNERVLVVICGEFSRTPKMNNGQNNGTPGRDHWDTAMFCLMGGGGVQGGRIVGATDRRGETVTSRPVCVGDVHATIYDVLGVDPHVTFLNHSGRPVAAIDEGRAIAELF